MKKSKVIKILILSVLIGLAGLLIVGNFKLNQKRKALNQKLEVLQKNLDQALKEKKALQRKISEAQNPDFLEKIAREDFNLKGEGEKVVAFVAEPEPQKTESQPEIEKSWWQKLLEVFRIK